MHYFSNKIRINLEYSEKNCIFEHLPACYSMFALILQVGTCRALHSKCHPRHFFTLVATFAKCSPYYSTLALFENRLRLLNQPLCRSYVSKLPTSSRETDSIDRIYYFSKKMLALLAYVHFL